MAHVEVLQQTSAVLAHLTATLDFDGSAREAAEQALWEACNPPGFLLTLCQIAARKDSGVGQRIKAFGILEDAVRDCWAMYVGDVSEGSQDQSSPLVQVSFYLKHTSMPDCNLSS